MAKVVISLLSEDESVAKCGIEERLCKPTFLICVNHLLLKHQATEVDQVVWIEQCFVLLLKLSKFLQFETLFFLLIRDMCQAVLGSSQQVPDKEISEICVGFHEFED